MKLKKFLFPAFLVCTVLAIFLRAFARPASAKPVSNGASYDAIDTYVEQQVKRLNIPGVSLAIVEGDQVVHLRSFGQARPGGEALSPQTPFVLGSTTKSFTALAIMQLVEAGKVALDTPVQHYLPWFRVADPQASAQMTVRHLLNQTSGLSSASGWIPLADYDDRPDVIERQARALATLELTRPVGSAFEYSNANYNLLGLIIEAASGETYAGYIQNHIFNPLGMSHSYTSQAMAKQNGLAVGHRYWFWFPIAAPNLPVHRGSLPAGQLISSAEDMGHYMIAQLNDGRYGSHQLLSPEGIAELHRGAAEFNEMGVSVGKYGMGWFISGTGQAKIVWHSGTVPDFASFMALLPEQKRGVVLLINADHFMMNPVLTEMGTRVATLLAGQQPAPGQFGAGFAAFAPWVMRALLLIPLLQIVGVAATLRRLSRWRRDPALRPGPARLWGLHLLLPLIPNLSLATIAAYLLSSKMLGFWLLFFPDGAWVALICGGFAGIWAFLRTGLTFWSLRKSSPPLPVIGQSGARRGIRRPQEDS